MPVEKGSKRVYFPKVKEARELLREKATEILNKYEVLIDAAIAAEDYVVASHALEFLMEHMPDEAGVRMIESKVDVKAIEAPKGPVVNIGFAIGGITKPEVKMIPEHVDAEVEDE